MYETRSPSPSMPVRGPRRLLLASLLALVALVGLGAAYALGQGDPAPPEGGFPVTQDFDNEVVLDDGYVTMVDAQYPAVAPPAGGWPVIFNVHGLGGSRLGSRTKGEDFARRGYFFYAIDVRGQGTLRLDPRNAGKGTTLIGLQERRDVKTHVDHMAGAYPGIADTTRLAMNGSSQGGAHGWVAAAWSGKLADATDPAFGTFPVFSAVAAGNMSPYRELLISPNGEAVRWKGATRALFPGGNLVLDPAFQALMAQLISSEDFQQLHALATDPNVDAGLHIADSVVPVFMTHGHHDWWNTGEPLVRAFHELGSGNAKRLILSTGGHGTPNNDSENAFRDGRKRAWFDQHLKGRETGALVGNRMEYSIIPSDPAVHDDPASRWDRRSLEDWPPPNAHAVRLYLKANGRMSLNEPGPSEPDLTIQQTVTPGYGMPEAIQDGLDAAAMLAHVSEEILTYDTKAANDPVTLTGDPTAHLALDMTGEEVQVTVRLLDVPPAGEARFIVAAHFARRFAPGETPPSAIDLALPPIAWRVETGHRLRVEISNISFFITNLSKDLWFVPYFKDFSVTIHHAQGTSSWVEVPKIPDAMTDAKLWSDRYDVSAVSGAFLNETFSTDTDYAGFDYLVLGSLSGTTPGFLEDGLPIWLNRDALYRKLANNPNFGPFGGMIGTLDPNGEAFPTLDLLAGLSPGDVGREISLAGRVLDPSGVVVATSNPITVTVMP